VTSSTTVGSRGHAAVATDTMQVDLPLPIAADPIQVDQSPIASPRRFPLVAISLKPSLCHRRGRSDPAAAQGL
jgi:hypothetical protein